MSSAEDEELRAPLDVVRGVITQMQESAEDPEEGEAEEFHERMDFRQEGHEGWFGERKEHSSKKQTTPCGA